MFDILYTNMIAAGEAGAFSDTVSNASRPTLRRPSKLKRAVQSAMVYPVAVFTIAVGVIIFILWKVVPIFVPFVRQFRRRTAPTDAHRDCHKQLRWPLYHLHGPGHGWRGLRFQEVLQNANRTKDG